MSVYLDHAATTPLIPEVLEAYTRALAVVGNPASIHGDGQRAKQMLEEAREELAASLNCDPVEVVFTSGGTEAINAALKGLYWARVAGGTRPVVLFPAGEHHATTDTVEWLESAEGAELVELPVDSDGTLRPDVFAEALAADGPRTALASVIWANNEVGTVQPVAELALLSTDAGVPVHSDAVGAFGSVPIDFRASGLSALSVSAHKIGGPVGVGALVLARGATLVPLLHGGGQQRKVRSGTQDVAGAVAFATAARIATDRLAEHAAAMSVLRDRLIAGVRSVAPDAVLRGATGTRRLPGNVHFTFPGLDGDSLLFLLDMAGVSVSTGSACTAGVSELSHVLLGMGLPESEARGALRITLGPSSTDADVDALLAALPAALDQARRAGHSSRTPHLGR
ncbi:cysteine desulfurase family protein [Herbiconiux sp. L3-i23]|uniref:cysteine desulfurase family protein n=1 Tax=Herbiconiux sp. L3-i23 TaxID=2905871 RepID=UPI0020645612|nr:cysteine desulfurase family protein [Herbiconiux sp. L3-i23]BDI21940.1 cysteine desulfurase [Herbiconiux sp. L3-i23]